MKNSNAVAVARETVINNVVVKDGNRVYNLSRSANGVTVAFGKKSSLFVPNGALGATILAELGLMIGASEVAEKPRRKRRTKAEIEAARALEANGE